MRRTEEDFHRVKELRRYGLVDYKIAELTGIPRGTVLRWRRRDQPPHIGLGPREAAEWEVRSASAYCYLLGIYLGDGHVMHKPPHSWTLRIACDRKYPGIIDEIRYAMEQTFPGRHSTRIQLATGEADVIGVCHPAVGRAFPQHGPGRKHLRKIDSSVGRAS